MKELTIEEKAKAYDEAIEKFDVILNLNTVKESGTIFADDVRKIFPELAESEDERIRKCLINQYKGDGCLCGNNFRISFEDIRAWLEKQGEQKTTEWNEKEHLMLDSIISIVEEWESNQSEKEKEYYGESSKSDWLKSLKDRMQPQYTWKPSDLPHWKKSTLPNNNTTGFNSDYFTYNGYVINYKELFDKLPKDD